MSSIVAVKMPKWGLSMQEGKVVHWWKQPGDSVREGEDLVDIETSKITNTAEAHVSGVVRRILAEPDETLPVGALLAVVADAGASDAEIDGFVTAFQANFTPEESEAEAEGALALRMVDVGGRRLRVGVGAGEGAPIVLLHGFGADLNNWLFNLDALGAAGPVIAIDLPGHGESDKDVGDGSLARLAGDVGAALKALGVDRAHLVGHSLGAAVAMQLALDRPGLARSLTLISPAGLPGSTLSRAFLDDFVDAERARDLKPVLEQLVADPALVSRDMVEDVLKFKRLDGAQEALAVLRDRMVAGADFKALQARLAELPAAQVIASRGDRIVGGIDEAALPADWRVAWIEGVGHVAQLERAAEVNALILKTVNG
jgi:pyruvate dehydrogenase E2 component (dihydrolipoamide acetyltransferase)